MWHPRNNDNQPKPKKKQKKPKNKPKSKSTVETVEDEAEAVNEIPKDDSQDEPAAVVESEEIVTEE